MVFGDIKMSWGFEMTAPEWGLLELTDGRLSGNISLLAHSLPVSSN
jgi:hypothetical protein